MESGVIVERLFKLTVWRSRSPVGARASWGRRCAGWFAGLVVVAGCATPDPIDTARELAKSGRRADAIESLALANRDGQRTATLQAELIRQRELQAARRLESFSEDLNAGRLEAASRTLDALSQEQPDLPRLPALSEQLSTARRHARTLQAAGQAASAGRSQEARSLVRTVLAEDPANTAARRLWLSLPQPAVATSEQSASEQLPEALRRPVTVEFRDATLRNVFETLTRMAQVNFVFDKDVRGDARVTVFLRGVSMDEAVRTILQTQGLDMRRLNDVTYMVFTKSAQKAREYVQLEARTFWLSNVDAKVAAQLLRNVVKSKDVHVDDKLNLLVIKDTPDALRLAAQLIQTLDVADSEVVLEIEVLEISRTRLQELGIRYPTQISYGLLPAAATGSLTGAATAAVGVITRENWAEQLAQIASPSLIANLRASDGAVNLLSNPRIRVRNREKAKIQVGEKVPVFTTQFAATGFGASNAIGASTTYIDVGLKVEVEPQIHHESEVSIKVALEVSNILEQVQGPAQTTAYRIGARQAQTNLRLRDAETQVLAGLISDNDRQFAQRVPGLGRMPVLGRLFSNERTETERTEIILMITPRIVRTVSGPLYGEAALIAGTEAAAGAAPLTLSARARTAVAPSGGGRPQAMGADGSAAASAGGPRATVLAAAGGAPQAPAASTLSEPIARLNMQAPGQVRAGQDFTLSLTMDEGVLVGPVEIDLEWDPAAFSLPASVTMSGGGKARVTLSGEGGPRTAQFRLRASPSGVTSGNIAAVAVRASAGDGRPADGVALPAPVSIGITP